MADVALQSGRLSAFAFAKQSAQSTTGTQDGYTSPTSGGRIDADAFAVTSTPNTVTYSTLNGGFDSVNQTRTGVFDNSATLSCPAYSTQSVPLIKACVGTDILSGAGATSFGTTAGALATVGLTTVTLSGSIPATPSGVADWVGAVVTIDTSTNAEDVFIMPGSTGTTLNFTPTKKTHASGVAVSVAKQHIFQPNVGASRANLDWISMVGQFGTLFERQLVDCNINSFMIRGDNERLTYDFGIASSNTATQTGSLTTLAYGTGEANDSPYIQRDGALYTYWAAADAGTKTLTAHNRLTALQYSLSYALQNEKFGGGVQLAMSKVPSARTQTLTWTELAGQKSANSTIYADYLSTQTEMPALLAFTNPKNGYSISVYMPRAVVAKFDPQGPADAPISWQGELMPLIDSANSGIAVRICTKNASTGTAY